MVPATPRLVDRGDLLAALDRAAARKVTIISAPAGSGKTSLLRAWVDRPGRLRRYAFVQVQRDQHDAQQFWLAVLNAIHHAFEATKRSGSPVATPEFNGQAMVDRALSALAEHRDGVIVVIDDLHELSSPEAIAQLTRLLTNLPSEVHAIVATRRDLQLGLHQLRLAGELAEIRAQDLRFSERETRELLDASGIALSDAAVALLHQRTEGWAAGLRLAAISLAGHHDPERFVAEFSGSNRTVAEYLIAEMLSRQPDDVQQLLLRTSVLDRVNGELADLLAGRPGSERILLELEDANAFVVSLDPERTWFRYHHLFGDLLRLELRRTLPEEVPALHRRAADWFNQRGQIVDAIRHMQAAGDWPGAAVLLADHSFSLMLDGHTQTMQALLRVFPEGVCADHPELAVVRATVDLVQGSLDEAAAHLRVAESHIETTPVDRRRRIRVAIASLKLSLARRRGDVAGVIEQSEFLASPLSGESEEDIWFDSDLRAVALMNLGIVEAWSGRRDEGQRHLTEGADLARRIGRPYLEVGCLAQLAFASRFGSFTIARRRCHEAITLAEQHGWGTAWILAPALVTLASTMIWMGDFDESEQWLHRVEQALQSDSGPGIRLLLHLANGMLDAGRGRHREALEEFGAAEHLQSQLRGPHALANQVTGWTAAAQARVGMLNEARASLKSLDDLPASSGEIRNSRAVICLADDDAAAALGVLKDVLDGTAPVIHDFTVVEAHLLNALAHRALGDQRAANQSTEAALALAEPDRLVLPFAMVGSAELLEALPRHLTEHASLLAGILDVVHGSSTPSEYPLPPTEELSPSELKVLRYLPTNLSRPEIARALSVSVNTVNTHVRNIYAKLQVRDRSSAVERARQLRLLSTGLTR